MPEQCENPLVEALLHHPEVQKRIQPKCDELRELEAKGFRRTSDDFLRIREIRSEIEDFIRRALEKAVIIDLDTGRSVSSGHALRRDEMVKLSNIHTDGANFATCDAGMFTTPWSRGFVHGADSALHIGDLAGKILKPQERIVGMKRITWRKPTTTNLKLAVYAQAFDDMDMSAYNLDGQFVTSGGRDLTFFAMSDEQSPITTHMSEANPYANNMLCTCEDCRKYSGGTTTYRLCELSRDMAKDLDSDASLRLSTTLELLTLAVAQSHHGADTERKEVLKLLAGVNDLVLPQSSGELCKGKLAVRLFREASRRGKSGMQLIPFEYRFPYMSKDGTGIVAVTQSVRCAEDVLDDGSNGGVRSGAGRRHL